MNALKIQFQVILYDTAIFGLHYQLKLQSSCPEFCIEEMEYLCHHNSLTEPLIFMRNVKKSEHLFKTPQKKEFLIYLHNLNCQQNSQVFFIWGPSFKALSMIASVPQKNKKDTFFGDTLYKLVEHWPIFPVPFSVDDLMCHMTFRVPGIDSPETGW